MRRSIPATARPAPAISSVSAIRSAGTAHPGGSPAMGSPLGDVDPPCNATLLRVATPVSASPPQTRCPPGRAANDVEPGPQCRAQPLRRRVRPARSPGLVALHPPETARPHLRCRAQSLRRRAQLPPCRAHECHLARSARPPRHSASNAGPASRWGPAPWRHARSPMPRLRRDAMLASAPPRPSAPARPRRGAHPGKPAVLSLIRDAPPSHREATPVPQCRAISRDAAPRTPAHPMRGAPRRQAAPAPRRGPLGTYVREPDQPPPIRA